MSNFILICNPCDFELCKQVIKLSDKNAKVEITQSSLVDVGRVLSVDISKAYGFSIDGIKQSVAEKEEE